MESLKVLPDDELVKLFCEQNSQDAMAVLYNRYRAELKHFFEHRFSMDVETSEDLVQQMFVSVICKIRSHYVGCGSFNFWLFRVANNSAIDYLRREKHMPHSMFCDPDCLYGGVNMGVSRRQIAFEFVLRKAESLIEQLPEDKRQLMEMRFKLHMTYREISEVLHIKKSTCVKRIILICNYLRKEMIKLGILEVPYV